jgi:outer membrane protein assembly factor BamB
VAGNRAITQEQRGTEECVTCYDIVTGKLLWSHADDTRFDEAMGGIGPRATPTVDVANGTVFTLGALGLLNCLDLTTGALRSSGAARRSKRLPRFDEPAVGPKFLPLAQR